MTADLVRAALVRQLDSADALRQAGCESHRPDLISLANRIAAETTSLLAECAPPVTGVTPESPEGSL